ncbi:MAG: AEC family transporter [Candidatus Omnitrophica bacterium]|nr:AEC family transporter [Candidatus Omnitrophota bacterium]
MLLASFTTTYEAVLELAILGAAGFFLVRRKLVSEEGLKTMSGLVIGLFLPLLMFGEITARFSFSQFSDWWIFPLLSLLVTAVGYFFGLVALALAPSLRSQEGPFLGIAMFQNSGYLPLPLAASMLSPAAASDMFIYIFLFLLGFNMTIFSFGVFVLSCRHKACRFDAKNMFNAPVIATFLALAAVFFGVARWIPFFVSRPVEMLGRCAIPLSILVVGGNLALIRVRSMKHAGPLLSGLALKLLVLPLVFLVFVLWVKPKPLVGLLLILQACMPPAALLSVIAKNQKAEEGLINQAIFYGHVISIVTIPLFLGLYGIFCGPLE